MEQFIIKAEESGIRNDYNKRCLKHDTTAFYNSEYHGGGRCKEPGTIENLICGFKNDFNSESLYKLSSCMQGLEKILATDLPIILRELKCETLRVCVIPRAKRENYYTQNQKLFRQTIQNTLKKIDGFEDGTYDIIRHIDSITTHLNRSGYGGEGRSPYPGITLDTCHISEQICGKRILLIDDLYTKSIGIDEDAIQALHEKGAKDVFFYSVGKTVWRY